MSVTTTSLAQGTSGWLRGPTFDAAFIAVPPKSMVDGVTTAETWPSAATGTVVGPPPVWFTTSEPETRPSVLGEAVNAIVHVALPATVPQLFDTILNPAGTVTLVTVMGFAETFMTVTVAGCELVPIPVPPKSTAAGDTTAECWPSAVSGIVVEAPLL